MIGYACNYNEMKIPQEMYLARKLLKHFKTDGKSQVTIKGDMIEKVVLSVQGKRNSYLKRCIYERLGECESYCNNTGSFEVGGLDADSGVTGRKIVQDSYGPRVPVGGGAFSGKDATKVDRSGAYMARFIALNILKQTNIPENEVLVKLGYVIGKAEPLMAVTEIRRRSKRGDGLQVLETFDIDQKEYDCRPQAIIERFNLRKPIYLQTARDGHFGIKSYKWEQT
jgi:S-adenosylmethionine synthetase